MRRLFISFFLLFAVTTITKAQYDIIPMPQKITFDKKGRTLIVNATTATTDKINADIANPEGWRITVDKKGITVEGSTEAGIFYAHQALRQVMASKPDTLPFAVIESSPRFAYRGMHLDICRHFFPKEVVKRYIDMLAMHGMNTFHWHLTDDQGWRIEIKKWPKLTEVGAWRQRTVIGRNMGLYDYTKHGGYYTQDDIREVVA